MRAAGLASLVAALIAVAASPAEALSVAIYPLDAKEAKAEDLAALNSLLAAALTAHAKAGGPLKPRTPMVLRAACPRPATTKCLAKLAGTGQVITGAVTFTGRTALVALTLVDAKATVSKPESYRLSLELETAQGARAALDRLGDTVAASETPTLFQTLPAPGVTPVERPGVPAAALAPAPAKVAEEHDPKLVAGPVLVAVGTALLAGGMVVGLVDRQVSTDLQSRYDSQRTTTADASAYAHVHTLNLTANLLLGAGALAAIGGGIVWGVAVPPAALRQQPESAAWRVSTGKITALAGVALLAGGLVFSLVDRHIAGDLQTRFELGTLTAADKASYDRVSTFNVLSNVLFATGAAATVGGCVLWLSAADSVVDTDGGYGRASRAQAH